MYPRSGCWYRETSACTLVPVFGTAEHLNVPSFRFFGTGKHPPKPLFWNPFANPRSCEGGKSQRRRDDNKNKVLFLRRGPWGSLREKRPKRCFFRGKRHDTRI